MSESDSRSNTGKPVVCVVVAGAGLRGQIVAMLREDGLDAVEYASAAAMLTPADDGQPTPERMVRLAGSGLLILDMGVAGLSAVRAAKLVKADPRTRHVPIIMLAGAGDDQSILESINAGAMDVLATPIDMRALRERINQALQRANYDGDTRSAAPIVFEFDDFLRRELRRAERGGEPLALLYGRVEAHRPSPARSGDRVDPHERKREAVIEAGLAAMREVLRDTDTVTRYGFLDFVVVLPLTGPATCAQVVEKAHEAFMRALHRDPHTDRVIRDIGLGWACFPAHASDGSTLISLARRVAHGGPAAKTAEHPLLEQVNTFCPLCETRFGVWRARPQQVRTAEEDSDLMPRFQGVNPLLYDAVVCPSCMYAGLLDDYHVISSEARRRIASIRKLLSALADGATFGGERDAACAARAYLLAAECNKRRAAPPGRTATTYHRAAWMLRLLKDGEKESRALTEALRHYAVAQRESRLEGLSFDQPTLLYVMGDLCLRLGDPGFASRCFAQAHALAMQQQRAWEEEIRHGTGIAHLARKRYQALKSQSDNLVV